jgi:hypothetical protein
MMGRTTTLKDGKSPAWTPIYGYGHLYPAAGEGESGQHVS